MALSVPPPVADPDDGLFRISWDPRRARVMFKMRVVGHWFRTFLGYDEVIVVIDELTKLLPRYARRERES
jgi:hypothetical protein